MMICRFVLLSILLSTPCLAIDLPEFLLNKKVKNQIEDKAFENAQDSATQLLKINPENGKYHHNLGQIQLLNKAPEKAEKSYQAALKLLPKNKQLATKLNLASSYLMQQKDTLAETLLKEILREDPNNMIAKNNLNVLYNLKQEEQQQEDQEQEQEEQEQEEEEQEEEKEQEQEQEEEEEEKEEEEEEEEEEEALDPEEEQKKQDAYDILETLSQREEEARKKHQQQKQQKGNVLHDW